MVTICNTKNGLTGGAGTNRGTGGGGGGAVSLRASAVVNVGGGSAGTSYSGGSAGGGVYRWSNSYTSYSEATFAASNAGANGGKGGQGFGYQSDHTNAYRNYGCGGAGNTLGTTQMTGTRGSTASYTEGQNGTGGLLVLYTDVLHNEGSIVSNGSKRNKCMG